MLANIFASESRSDDDLSSAFSDTSSISRTRKDSIFDFLDGSSDSKRKKEKFIGNDILRLFDEHDILTNIFLFIEPIDLLIKVSNVCKKFSAVIFEALERNRIIIDRPSLSQLFGPNKWINEYLAVKILPFIESSSLPFERVAQGRHSSLVGTTDLLLFSIEHNFQELFFSLLRNGFVARNSHLNCTVKVKRKGMMKHLVGNSKDFMISKDIFAMLFEDNELEILGKSLENHSTSYKPSIETYGLFFQRRTKRDKKVLEFVNEKMYSFEEMNEEEFNEIFYLVIDNIYKLDDEIVQYVLSINRPKNAWSANKCHRLMRRFVNSSDKWEKTIDYILKDNGWLDLSKSYFLLHYFDRTNDILNVQRFVTNIFATNEDSPNFKYEELESEDIGLVIAASKKILVSVKSVFALIIDRMGYAKNLLRYCVFMESEREIWRSKIIELFRMERPEPEYLEFFGVVLRKIVSCKKFNFFIEMFQYSVNQEIFDFGPLFILLPEFKKTMLMKVVDQENPKLRKRQISYLKKRLKMKNGKVLCENGNVCHNQVDIFRGQHVHMKPGDGENGDSFSNPPRLYCKNCAKVAVDIDEEIGETTEKSEEIKI